MSITSKQLKRIKQMAFDFVKERNPGVKYPLTGEPILTEANKDLGFTDVLDPIQSQLTYMWFTDQFPMTEDKHYDNAVYFLANLGYYEVSTKALVQYALAQTDKVLGTKDGAGVSIHDFGAGVGLSTLHICRKWPLADVHYSEVEGIQVDFMRMLKDEFKLDNLHIAGIDIKKKDGSYFPDVDVSLALDVFEHIREPVPVLERLLKSTKKVYVDNSSFGRFWEGHYNWYINDGIRLYGNVSRTRSKRLRDQTYADGRAISIKDVFYEHVERDFEFVSKGFNGSPAVYKRK